MEREKSIRLKRVGLWSSVETENFSEDVQRAPLRVVKKALETALDAMHDEAVETNRHERTKRRRVTLVAYGITFDGRKEPIGFRLGKSESGAARRHFLLSLHSVGS